MIITWQGHSCFKIQDKVGSDGVTVVTDPFSKEIGLKAELKVPNFEADIVTVSHQHHDHSNVEALRGNPFTIDCAGEYDFKGVLIEGIDSYHDEKEGAERGGNIIYRIEIDDISVTHLGDLGHVLSDAQIEKLAGTDILLIPVGGPMALDAKKAVEVISQIEPRIVIPMHYKTKDSKLELDGVEKFIKEIGLTPTYEEKLKISKKDLPSEDMELVILSI
ncbi:MAG: MBL fold metallo-hydrolase [Patescibacteria group bacterium]|jgi:L-ascorbate metabolism protein UlaG (beta-lactamase superfamily)